MVAKENWIERLAGSVDLAGETLPGQTVVEILGEHRVLIEHHLGVTRYCEDNICVKVKYGNVIISGTCLQICHMTKAQLVISGRIENITLHRRCP